MHLGLACCSSAKTCNWVAPSRFVARSIQSLGLPPTGERVITCSSGNRGRAVLASLLKGQD